MCILHAGYSHSQYRGVRGWAEGGSGGGKWEIGGWGHVGKQRRKWDEGEIQRQRGSEHRQTQTVTWSDTNRLRKAIMDREG